MTPSPAVFCTVATRSHVDAAAACLESLRAFHPGAQFALLAIGEGVTATPGLRLLALEDCMPRALASAMRSRYTIAELCSAAKPFLLGKLLEDGAIEVHYLDADCLAYASLAPLQAQLAGADLLLTPHALTPIPDDGRTPRPLTVLRGGTFNAGYLGVRNTLEGRRFTAWHSEMTQRWARNAPDEGMCFDQRWLDLVPALFPGAALCRHPGANVAYWNLHERSLSQDSAGGFRVNGEPLLFFHFSGWRIERPEALSIHQNRHRVREAPALAALIEGYRARLPQAAKPSWWKLGLPARA